MKQIIYLAQNGESAIIQKLTNCISHISNGTIDFFCYSEIPKTISPDTILILSRQIHSIQLFDLTHPVLISSDTSGISDCLMKQRAQIVYTCGFSKHDCMSFSSVLDEQCMISLNRAIKTLDGHLIEPFEMPISFRAEQSFLMLSCLLGILLCDISPETIFEKLSCDNSIHSSHTMFANTTKQIEE